MASSSWIDLGIQHLSESVFLGLCHKVGTSQQVTMRREILDMEVILKNQVMRTRENDRDKIETIISGSYREGFRLEGSDIDIMMWPPDHNIIWDLDQAQNYDLNRKTLILCDCSESPPGFALLELLTGTRWGNLMDACIRINDRLYISSSKFRRIPYSSSTEFKEHGPCGNGFFGVAEYDIALCLVCNFWPPPAFQWRQSHHSWPPPPIIDEIVRKGCHFVAVGHKLGNHTDKEWRISFSLAEQYLVSSMNHCQFLTYGLLKLFLKECMNSGLSEEDKLLCSYHMKTVVFWVIQLNIMPCWCPQNFLQCFWVCFKLILKWVYEGICPNFFIPENNMFLSNIHGKAQRELFIRLHEIYEKGLACLLYSPSIRSHVIRVLQNPMQSVCIEEHPLISRVVFEVILFREISHCDIPIGDLHHCMMSLDAVGRLITLSLTQYQKLILQTNTASILQSTAFYLLNSLTESVPFEVDTSTCRNKVIYLTDKRSLHMMKLAAKFGFISDRLFIVMYFYKRFRYLEALIVTKKVKIMLEQPYVVYRGRVNAWRYSEDVGNLPLSTKMRKAVAWDISLNNKMCYINELVPEQQSGLQWNYPVLYVPLYVLLHMLEILCYRHVDPVRTQRALNDLQYLVHHDPGSYIYEEQKDISWEILGICQQITGNYQAALYSYRQSLTQKTFHKIQTATLMRIQQIMDLINRV
ncbi:uncharacterized protein LOC134270467 [Saccostrea cucullata]|uniref:uncharacterized protein LOC134270467 n=1 Tax=Saccostrea cuccullata TaxID=36930 RepID=UPI002ED02697